MHKAPASCTTGQTWRMRWSVRGPVCHATAQMTVQQTTNGSAVTDANITHQNTRYTRCYGKTAQSFAHHFKPFTAEPRCLHKKCSTKIVVYQMWRNLCKLVKYSLLRSHKWLHVRDGQLTSWLKNCGLNWLINQRGTETENGDQNGGVTKKLKI